MAELARIQEVLLANHIPAWLIHDFRGGNPIAARILGLPADAHFSRTFFVLIPAHGTPRRFVSPLEAHLFTDLPGEETVCPSWRELDAALSDALSGVDRVAMEVADEGRVPTVSYVDAGTVERVRSCGVDVVTSMSLVQALIGVVDEEGYASHVRAAGVVSDVMNEAWAQISESITVGRSLTDFDVQQYMASRFSERGMDFGGFPPIVALNECAAIPHFSPTDANVRPIRRDDVVLIDAWCRESRPEGIWADFTRMGVVAERVPERPAHLFEIVRDARDAAIDLVRARVAAGAPLAGYEVDDVCRSVIDRAGFGAAFVHRTGHSIGTDIHDVGVNLDNFESHDCRELLPGSLVSVEPGIYLAGEIGIRSEVNLYVHPDGTTRVSDPDPQMEIRCLL